MHKKILNLMVAFTILGLLLAGCGTENKMDFYEGLSSTDLSNESIKRISIGSEETKVRDIFGKPDFKNETEESYYLIYGETEKRNNIEFRVTDKSVDRINVSTTKYKTAKGISIGDSEDKVIKVYGKNYYKRENTGALNVGYFDKENNINIEFALQKSEVIGFIIEKTKN